MQNDILRVKLDRAKNSIEQLEKLIEDKNIEAFDASSQLTRTNQSLNKLYKAMPSAMLVVSADGEVEQFNRAAANLLGYSDEKLLGLSAERICKTIDKIAKLQTELDGGYQEELEWITVKGERFPVLVSASLLDDTDVFDCSYVFIASDLRDRKQMELELRHSQKLESIGQLAAGVAHEINTPMQYIGDNVFFMQESIGELLSLIELYKKALSNSSLSKEILEEIAELEEDTGLDYLTEQVPEAANRTLQGVGRVTKIVSAMKAFSHPSNEKVLTDANEIIDTALTVSTSEYNLIADVKKNFGDIPQVHCNVGDMNQVLLNLIVNASHAIADRGSKEKGLIEITTRKENEAVIIEIKDSGTGVPEHAQSRIFDPFYTTKEVGQGTGQGLALAYVVVVEKHHGKIYFETKKDIGTTFFVHLPLV